MEVGGSDRDRRGPQPGAGGGRQRTGGGLRVWLKAVVWGGLWLRDRRGQGGGSEVAFDFAGGSCCKVRAEDPELGPVRTSSIGPGWVGVGIAFECDGEQKSQRPPALAGPSDPGCVGGGRAHTFANAGACVCPLLTPPARFGTRSR